MADDVVLTVLAISETTTTPDDNPGKRACQRILFVGVLHLSDLRDENAMSVERFHAHYPVPLDKGVSTA